MTYFIKKFIILLIPLLLVFGSFCHAVFAQDFSKHDQYSSVQDILHHNEQAQHNECGTSSDGCVMQHNQNQLDAIQNTNQKTKKTSETTPVFTALDYRGNFLSSLDKRSIFYDNSFLSINIYLNWPVGLARSNLL